VGDRVLTPLSTENQPSLPALRYRSGTHGAFLQSMYAGIAASPPLRGLTTRDRTDFTIGLADAWASVLDVLTFYQERIANEGYLRTAVERQSVLDLAAEIGYRPSPGVAASTQLVFQLETAPGTPDETVIPRGAKVQSLPGPGETPQMFETSVDWIARRAWDNIGARTTKPVDFNRGLTYCYFSGVATNLQKGDFVLFVGARQLASGAGTEENWDFRRLLSVFKDPMGRYTRIDWEEGLGSGRWNPPYQGISVYALRTRAQLFGYNAPDWTAMIAEVQTAYRTRYNVSTATDWPGLSRPKVGTNKDDTNPTDVIFLDALYPSIVAGSWVVLNRPNHSSVKRLTELFRVTEAAEDSRSDFGMSVKAARLTLAGEGLSQFDNSLRQTVVYGQSELLPLAEEPITDTVAGQSVTLDRAVADLAKDMAVMISETRTGEIFPFQQEVAWIAEVANEDGLTKLTFNAPLKNTYGRENVRFHFNVVAATHGETRAETLGSGDGARANQSFVLKQKPLTYVSAANADGRASTLTVRVDGVAWEETDSLYARAEADRVFTTWIADPGDVTVQFGDGMEGRRLPTGVENVTALYRTGIGLSGLLKAGQLTLLMTRPLGVKSVTNPEAPAGAEDPETLDDARRSAPLNVMAFGRIVSVRDFERYTQIFPGIAKARADLLWDGENRMASVTVALEGDAVFDAASEGIRNLNSSLRQFGDPFFPFEVRGYRKRLFRGAARIAIETGRVFEDVRAACVAAIEKAYSFDAGVLARSVAASAVIAALQTVPGVAGVDLDSLYLEGTTPAAQPATRLEARPARWENGAKQPADLLVLTAGGFTISEMQP
jgi:predicted phage baseplate assembly protein